MKRSKYIGRGVSLLLAFIMLFALMPNIVTVNARATTEAAFTTTPMVVAGSSFTMGLNANGTVWAWGDNTHGQLGDGTDTNRYIPVQVQGLNNITAIAAGASYAIALRNDGTVWTWGSNWAGQLGDGTDVNRPTPIQVQGLNNVMAIAAGGGHTVALLDDGAVWTWGSNRWGQLGDDTTTNRNTPVQVLDINNVTAIAAGYAHTVALRSDGTAWAWGLNVQWQLGDGTATNSHVPVQVQDLTNVTAIAAGSRHTLAIRDDSTLWAWGNNSYGQLGEGTHNLARFTPVQVQNIDNVTAVSGGTGHTLATTTDGMLWVLGNRQSAPVQADDRYGIVSFAASTSHSVALKYNGTVWVWGRLVILGGGDPAGGHAGAPANAPGRTADISDPIQVVGPNGEGYLNLMEGPAIDWANVTAEQGGYLLMAFINRPSPIVRVGEALVIFSALYRWDTGEAEELVQGWDWNAASIIVSDTSVLSVEPNTDANLAYNQLIVTALSPGISDITIADINSDAKATISIEVIHVEETPNSYRLGYIPTFYAYENAWWARQIQTNFAFDGLYINSFNHSHVSGGFHVQFNVYNSLYLHGAVDIFDSRGQLINSYRIDKFTNVSGIWETGVAAWDLVRNTFQGGALCYTADSYSKRTRIDIFVPEGGHFTISANAAQSPGVMLYNAFDFILVGASAVISRVAGAATADAAAKNFVDNLLSSEKFILEFTKKLGNMAIEAQIANFWDMPSTLADQVIGIIDLSEISLNTVLSVALGVSESAFTAAAGPAGFGLEFIFEFNRATDLYWQILQLRRSCNAPIYTIFTPEPRGSFTVYGVTAIPSDGAMAPDAVLQVFRITQGEPNFPFDDVSQYELLSISFVRNGNENVPPTGLITVKLPIPLGFDSNSLQVWHDIGEGLWMLLDISIDGDHIVFETNRFSVFAIVEAGAALSENSSETSGYYYEYDSGTNSLLRRAFNFVRRVVSRTPLARSRTLQRAYGLLRRAVAGETRAIIIIFVATGIAGVIFIAMILVAISIIKKRRARKKIEAPNKEDDPKHESKKDEVILKNKLKKAREEKNLSQAALAATTGISIDTIKSIEEGQICPSARLALILCIALDTKFEDLFFFD